MVVDSEQALDFVAKVSKPVFDNHHLIIGYAASGADKPDPSGQKSPARDATSVTDAVFRFADPATAKAVARELEDTDIAVSPDNRPLTSKKYPEALVHWRPGVPTVGNLHGLQGIRHLPVPPAPPGQRR